MISDYMRDDHRACDHLYTEAETALRSEERRVGERV
mgnify:CR=1 FL=1